MMTFRKDLPKGEPVNPRRSQLAVYPAGAKLENGTLVWRLKDFEPTDDILVQGVVGQHVTGKDAFPFTALLVKQYPRNPLTLRAVREAADYAALSAVHGRESERSEGEALFGNLVRMLNANGPRKYSNDARAYLESRRLAR